MITLFGLGHFPAGSAPDLPTLRSDLVQRDDLVLAIETCDAAPVISAESLRLHDAAVRNLAAQADAFLPARFGQVFADRAALLEAVASRAAAFAEALSLVRGCSQMTLRWFGESAAVQPPAEPEEPSAGPGAQYLARRRAALAAETSLPELTGEHQRLQPFVRAERVRRGGSPGLLGTVYHLVADSDLARYRAELEQLPTVPTLRLQASGPWPNYAFAPELAA